MVDCYNNSIRVIANGTVSTVAGSKAQTLMAFHWAAGRWRGTGHVQQTQAVVDGKEQSLADTGKQRYSFLREGNHHAGKAGFKRSVRRQFNAPAVSPLTRQVIFM